MSKVNVNREELTRMASKVIEMLLVKNKEYGNAWEDLDIFTPLMRIREKLIRVETLTTGDGKAIVAQEGADKELPDIAGYCLLGMLKFEANMREKLEDKFVETLELGGIPKKVVQMDFETMTPEEKIKIIANCVLHENDEESPKSYDHDETWIEKD